MSGEGDILKTSLALPEFSGREFPLLSSLPKVLGRVGEGLTMSSLVQRQSERLIFGRAAPHIFDEVYNNRYMRRKYASMTPE